MTAKGNIALDSISYNSIHHPTQQLIDIINFDIVDGQRRYLTEWKLRNGQITTRWVVLSELGQYISKLWKFETQSISMIQQKQKKWRKTSLRTKSNKSKRISAKVQSESPMLTRNQRKTISQLFSEYSQPRPSLSLPPQIPIDQLDDYDVSKQSSSQQPCFGNIYTDQSEDLEDSSDQFSYESKQSSWSINKSQQAEAKQKELQTNRDNFVQSGKIGNVICDFGQSIRQSSPRLYCFSHPKQQQPNKSFELMMEDFEQGIRYFSQSNSYCQPQDFCDYASLHVVSQRQILSRKPKIVNIIRFYNLREGLFLAVNVGSLYHQDQRFIEYRLLKQYYPVIIFTWLLILSQ